MKVPIIQDEKILFDRARSGDLEEVAREILEKETDVLYPTEDVRLEKLLTAEFLPIELGMK